MKRVIVFGTFDIIHPGHLSLFRQARRHGDVLTVVIARDKTVERLKKRAPVNGEKKRLQAVVALGVADRVRLGRLNAPHRVISEERADVVCLGYDQTFFTENLEKKFPKLRVVRLRAYRPQKYKSSLLRAKK